tara:strand:- start:4956 stop:5549 length:594 start_codon:yes stop_codon:yes gene_type:complete
MKKNEKKIQLVLLSIGILLVLVTYFYYPYINENKFLKGKSVEKDVKKEDLNDEQDQIFENLEYKGFYDLNKPFIVKSESAFILNEEPDIVHMNSMHVILYLNDGRIVDIVSDKGRYNKITYDCFFEKNVKATDGETVIFSDNLDLLATKNIVEIYNNVNLNYPTGSLVADKIDYNFETKNFLVSMFGEEMIKMKVVK